jgi:hypothetical protein
MRASDGRRASALPARGPNRLSKHPGNTGGRDHPPPNRQEGRWSR